VTGALDVTEGPEGVGGFDKLRVRDREVWEEDEVEGGKGVRSRGGVALGLTLVVFGLMDEVMDDEVIFESIFCVFCFFCESGSTE
jgi:hypothetical protein